MSRGLIREQRGSSGKRQREFGQREHHTGELGNLKVLYRNRGKFHAAEKKRWWWVVRLGREEGTSWDIWTDCEPARSMSKGKTGILTRRNWSGKRLGDLL